MEGDKEMVRRLRTLADQSTDRGLRKQVRNAAKGYAEQELLPRVQGHTPIKSGRLMRSEKVRVLVSPKKGEVRIALCAGGPFALYARKIHDDPTLKHKVGGPFFITAVIYEAAPTAANRICARIDVAAAMKG